MNINQQQIIDDPNRIGSQYLNTKGLEPIYVQLKNNTSVVQTPVLFQTVPTPDNPIQLRTLFSYDLTIYINNNIKYIYIYYSVADAPFQQAIYTSPNPQITSVNEILNWLNTLNIGQFSILTGDIVEYYSVNTVISIIQGGNDVGAVSAVSDTSYNINGSLLYDPGYTLNGVGNFTLLPSNTLWQNAGANLTDGRFNNTGTFWYTGNAGEGTTSMPFTTTNNQVYIGLSYINLVNPIILNIYVNNVLILEIDAAAVAAMQANIDTILGGSYTDVLSSFWHIFPVNLIQRGIYGSNLLTIEGGATHSNNINIGLEIYDNTAAQITAATSTTQLNILNSVMNNGYFIAKF